MRVPPATQFVVISMDSVHHHHQTHVKIAGGGFGVGGEGSKLGREALEHLCMQRLVGERLGAAQGKRLLSLAPPGFGLGWAGGRPVNTTQIKRV